VNGVVLKGTITTNQDLMLGPDRNGNFKMVTVKGIHENRVPIEIAP
jgi:GTPase